MRFDPPSEPGVMLAVLEPGDLMVLTDPSGGVLTTPVPMPDELTYTWEIDFEGWVCWGVVNEMGELLVWQGLAHVDPGDKYTVAQDG